MQDREANRNINDAGKASKRENVRPQIVSGLDM